MSSKNQYQEINDFFSIEPGIGIKAWDVIHDFYHSILTIMSDNNIKRIDLANRLNKSRSAISKMLNGTPNITINKMVELAEAVGMDIKITLSPKNFQKLNSEYKKLRFQLADTVEVDSECMDDFEYPSENVFPMREYENIIIQEDEKQCIEAM
jgi:transcriptional regulator with XRE-family HTH domain